MFYGLDLYMILFVGFYGAFAGLCFLVAYRKFKKYLEKKKKPKLTLIQGGKKEDGPYGNL